jgi:hypothetical protein
MPAVIADEVLAPDLALARDVDPELDLLAHHLDRRPIEERQPFAMLAPGRGIARARLGGIRPVVRPQPVPNRQASGPRIGPDRGRQQGVSHSTAMSSSLT